MIPPGYKQTEVGVIPVEWESVKAGDIGRFRGGNGFPLRFQGETASGYPFYKVSDMNNEGNETFMFDSNNWISEGIRKQLGATAFPADTIIFAKVGAAVFLERKKILTKPSCIDNNLCGLVLDKSRTHVRFVHYSLLNIKFGSLVSTTALPSLSGTVLSQITFALPPLPEQRAIATALSDVDALLAALDRLIAKQRDLKQAAMQQLLTGQTRLPGFEGEWRETVLSRIGKFKNGLNKDSSAFGHGSPFVNLMDVFGVNAISATSHLGLVASTKMDKDVYDLQQGDVLFIRSSVKPSGVGLTAVVERDLIDTVYSGFLIRFRDDGALDNGFKKHCFYAETFRKKLIAASSVSANTNINQNALGTLTLLLPPIKDEQTAIATVLSDMDAELAALEQRRDKTRALKQGMMQELLTGRTRLVASPQKGGGA